MAERIQRQRTKGWWMPEGAVYVGRPSQWGNPFAWNDERAVWMALAVGERADAAGRRAAAVKLYRWWISGADRKTFPLDTKDHDGPAIEYSDGKVRSMRSIASGMGAMMWLREPITIPPQPDIEPLRGKDLVCWCPEACGEMVALYGVAYGDLYEPCAKPRGHASGHDPSVAPWCHADVLLELAMNRWSRGEQR